MAYVLHRIILYFELQVQQGLSDGPGRFMLHSRAIRSIQRRILKIWRELVP